MEITEDIEKTTIPCTKKTRARLKGLAKKNESWNDTLNRFADEHEELHRDIKNMDVVVISKCNGNGLIQICNDGTMQISVVIPTVDGNEIAVWKTFGSDNGVLEKMKNELHKEAIE